MGTIPDFPSSAGDRERGRFRKSATPRQTQVAVCDDEGQSIVRDTDQILEELLNEVRLFRQALVLQGLAADIGEM